MGIVRVASLAAKLAGEPEARMRLHLQVDQLGRELGQSIVAALREAILNDNVLALDVAALAQPQEKALDHKCPALTRANRQKADSGCFPGLLTARQKAGEGQGQSALQKPPTTEAMSPTHSTRTIRHHAFSDAESGQ